MGSLGAGRGVEFVLYVGNDDNMNGVMTDDKLRLFQLPTSKFIQRDTGQDKTRD